MHDDHDDGLGLTRGMRTVALIYVIVGLIILIVR